VSNGLIGKKLGMTRIFLAEGSSVPVTVIEAGPNKVIQVKTKEKEGYEAVKLGFGFKKHANQPESGEAKVAGLNEGSFKLIKEYPLNSLSYERGQDVTLTLFNPGEKISVTGTSKGKGFAGVMKRHGFGGGRATNGCLTPRSAGSIGCAADPSRVFPGKKMAGHTGAAQVTVKNLQIVDVRPEYGVILVKGAVPGPNGGLVLIRKS
jgi:large subunit ribosomal protein L3